ncbi:MAG TPA: TrkH family potassium uptake protein [Candidatus Desulfaltia sp.]|nr:TrkH family potassium uptake protein [Candidatus Desulfaltia sp.]
MNFRAVIAIQGLLLIFQGFFMLLPLGFSLYYGDDDVVPILVSAGITLAAGFLLRLLFRFQGELRLKESFATVSLGWVFAALFGALPFIISGYIPSFTNAFFESMSGFTTTGATILADIEALPHGLLFWRSLTHWLGGMGIIVLSLAILPLMGVGGMQLYKAEIPGPTPDKLTPRIQQTAKSLWGVYVLLSVVETGLLMAGGLNLFDGLCHTFGSMATGGFSTKTASIGHFNSVYIEAVVIVFMVLAGTNFALHFHSLKGRPSAYWKSEEFRFYLGVILFFTVLLTAANALAFFPKVLDSFRYSAFHVVSITTTTGFTTFDFGQWPAAARIILLILMFIGGSAGSTGGSIKILRIMILVKQVRAELKKLLHPRAVISVRVDGQPVQPRVVINILSFIFLYIMIFIAASLVMGLLGLDLDSAFSSVAATLGNVGPGLGIVGPAAHYFHVPMLGKWILAFCMLAGRLEIYTVLVLCTREFWK